jgi:hypothetical protein
MSETNGGSFYAPAKSTTQSQWGTLQLDFSSCTKATGTLTSTDNSSSVTFTNLIMLAGVMNTPPGC